MPVDKYIGRITKKPELRIELIETPAGAAQYIVSIFDNNQRIGIDYEAALPLKSARFQAITQTLTYIHRPHPQPWEVTDASVTEEDFRWEPPLEMGD